MNYIVFDLEWNQNPSGKKTRNDRLPFEIIEIGAVKVNSKKEITDHFHRLIKPQVREADPAGHRTSYFSEVPSRPDFPR